MDSKKAQRYTRVGLLNTDRTDENEERRQYVSTHGKEVRVLYQSPWKTYRKIFLLKLGLGETSIVAEKLSPSIDDDNSVVLVQKISSSNVQDQMEDTWFVAFEFMPISLSEFAGNPLLNELRVASILGQVVNGLEYLARIGLEHGQLTCSHVLVGNDGLVKLWGQEHCRARSGRGRDIRALATVTMELVQGYVEDDRHVGIDDLERWHDTHVITFLSEIECVTSVDQLLKHDLLQLPWHQNVLQGMLTLANVWASWNSRYPA